MTEDEIFDGYVDETGDISYPKTKAEKVPKWKTRDGRVMEIAEMNDKHLLNALNYCRKIVCDFNDMVRCESHPVFAPRGDGACEAFERELNSLYDKAAVCNYIETFLEKEVNKRGLTPLPLPEPMVFPEIEKAYDVPGGGTIFKLKQPKRKEKKMDKEKNTTVDSPGDLKTTHEFFIAGVQHHQMHKVLGDMSVNDVLAMVPEPTNRFDPNAVRLEYEGMTQSVMCGYVPKKFSSEVSADIAIGTRLECVVIELNKTAKPWEQCKVQIRVVPDELEEVESDG